MANVKPLLVLSVLVYLSLSTYNISDNNLCPIEDPCNASSNRKPKNERLPANCTNFAAMIDSCATKSSFSFSEPSNPFPKSIGDLRKACERLGDGLKCMKNYNKCQEPTARRIINTFITGRSKHTRQICTNLNSKKSNEFYTAFECIYKHKEKKYIAGEKELTFVLQSILNDNVTKWEQKFHRACCSATNFRTKLTKDAEPECHAVSEPVEDMFESTVGDLLETACPTKKKLDELCPKLPKLASRKFPEHPLVATSLQVIVNLINTDPHET